MAFEHSSGLPAAYDRSPGKGWSEVVVREDRFAQGSEINEIQSILAARGRRVGNLTARDGDRVEGCEITVVAATGPTKMNVAINAGRVYVDGDVLPVPASSFSGLTISGEVTVGVRLIKTVVTELQDPDLLGLHPGSEAESEPGAGHTLPTISWALSDDGDPGQFFSVYLIKNGAVIDQSPPPALSGVTQQIAVYDFDALGNYIVDGCEVIALGKVGSDQVFSINAGTANIKGYKRIREASLRHFEEEQPDIEPIAAEPHTFTGTPGGTTVTETIVRGASPNSSDDLGFSSVVAIESVTQGGTTFVPTTDYLLAADAVSWAPGGTEPAAGSSYSVTYRYNSAVTPTNLTDTTLEVSGGVNGTTVLVSYQSKLPRIDILCLDISGRPVYVKGVSARSGALPPLPPSNLLKLCDVYNDWLGAAEVDNTGTRNYTADEQRRLFDRLVNVLELFDRYTMEAQITAAVPVAKKGIFTDSFVDDFFRDQGAAQTAAVNKGILQLAIDDVLIERSENGVELLPWTEEIVIRQDIATSSIKINPYQNFTRMPAGLTLRPAVDFWTDEVSEWTSPITREFSAAPNEPPGQTTLNEVTEIRRVAASFLRQISLNILLEGFGVGENLATLTLDGVNIKPAGTQTGDSNGEIDLTVMIPAGIPVGRRLVRATGMVDSFAEAIFVGEGTVDITTMRRVTLIARAAPDPIVVVQNNVTVINQIEISQITNVVNQTVAGAQENIAGGGGDGGGNDPLAQTFTLPEPRHIVGVNFKMTAVGDETNGLRVQLANVQNGYPTNEVLAEAFISMVGVEAGDVIEARFAYPVPCRADREYCFVILTADGEHSVAIAKLGDIDVPTQTRVSAQPYTVGVLLTSANRLTWTPFQEADMTFDIVCARFSPTTRTVNLLTADLATVSDIVVRGAVELPTQAATFRYEIVRPGGAVIALAPGQTREFTEFLTETVTLRAVLAGSQTISPVLFPGTLLIGGRIRTSGTYITRAFTMGSAVDIRAIMASFLPAGSSVSVDVDAVDNSWQALSSDGSTALGEGWNDSQFRKNPFTAVQGRIRVTLNGGPGARCAVARLRAFSI